MSLLEDIVCDSASTPAHDPQQVASTEIQKYTVILTRNLFFGGRTITHSFHFFQRWHESTCASLQLLFHQKELLVLKGTL